MICVDGVYKKGIILNCRVCGEGFEVKSYHSNRRKLCGKPECVRSEAARRMREFRSTDAGKAAIKKANLAYKRPDVEIVCKVCGEVFKTARKNRYICNKSECQKKGRYERIKKYRANNIEKNRARDIVSKSINRERSMIRKPCEICGSSNSEAHHSNYDRGHARNVVFLCKTHHHELHSWDSN